MNTKWQLVLSVTLVLAAGAVVGVYSAFGDGGAAPQEMDGHVHGAAPDADAERQPVHLDSEQARRIGVTYAEVELRALDRSVHATAYVAYDEARLTGVSPRVDGWVERLHVNYTGQPIRKGDPLFEIYSPALVSAQEELLLARSLVDETAANGGTAGARAERLLASARQRLDYWNVPEDQVRDLEARGTPTRSIVFRAPSDGIVVEKNVVEGTRIAAGTDVYRVADLSRVWVKAEVFERDVGRVAVGQEVCVSLETYPGETFHGEVTYVDPTVSHESRSARVRIELDNPGLRLKPGMYAQAELHDLGNEEVMVIPRTALLVTGQRSIVFVQHADGSLVPHEVTPGHPVGREIEILRGLEVGDRVVSSATFLVDAEANLGAALEAMAGSDEHDDHDAPAPAAGGHVH